MECEDMIWIEVCCNNFKVDPNLWYLYEGSKNKNTIGIYGGEVNTAYIIYPWILVFRRFRDCGHW